MLEGQQNIKLLRHKSWPLKIIVLVCAGGLFVLGSFGLFHQLSKLRSLAGAVVLLLPLFLLVWATALARMTTWAAVLAKVFLFGTAIFAPIMLSIPDRAKLIQSSSDSLSTAEGLLIAAPIVVVSLFAVHLLGKYRDDFKWRWI